MKQILDSAATIPSSPACVTGILCPLFPSAGCLAGAIEARSRFETTFYRIPCAAVDVQ